MRSCWIIKVGKVSEGDEILVVARLLVAAVFRPTLELSKGQLYTAKQVNVVPV